ncbi:MAG TPA: polysaccharide deacetylase family protein, partial [Sphingobacterium sp.]|nr:polysaccharide deacetylase family protein [Sphingobacterium sp.]
MIGIRSGFVYLLGFTAFVSHLFSCQNILSSTLGFAADDTTASLDTTVLPDPEPQAKQLLLQTWDSLQRNLLVFDIDSLNSVDIKTQKRRGRDSLRKEFDKHPKHVFLTFDDGPLVGSAAIDSIARARKIKVSTFLVGRHVQMGSDRKRDLERYQSNPYVACYNHSYTHGLNKFNAFYNNPASAYADFEKNEEDLVLQHKIARLPGRNVWIYDDVRRIDLQSGSGTADLLYSHGYKIYGWDVEWRRQKGKRKNQQPLEEKRPPNNAFQN